MLKGDVKCLLDHSIGSDQRLLQYTIQVFVTPSQELKAATDGSSLQTKLKETEEENKCLKEMLLSKENMLTDLEMERNNLLKECTILKEE